MRYELELFGVNEYEKFNLWAFGLNPGQTGLENIPSLWRHHEKCPINPQDDLMGSIKKMADLYLLENSETGT